METFLQICLIFAIVAGIIHGRLTARKAKHDIEKEDNQDRGR